MGWTDWKGLINKVEKVRPPEVHGRKVLASDWYLRTGVRNQSGQLLG